MPDLFGGALGGQQNYGNIAGKNEKKRQNLIDLGMRQINAVYGGGTVPFYSLANTGENKFDPHSSYYSLNATGGFKPYWTPGGRHPQGTVSATLPGEAVKSGGGDLLAAGAVKALGLGDMINKWFGKSESPQDVARKAFRHNQLFNAPSYQTFEGFQDPFFQKRAQDYVNFALPQEAQQYQQNRLAQTYGLANRGLSDSSVATQAHSNLERTAGQAKQTIADTALQQANQLRQDVENARQQNIQQLYQTADPAGATASAVNTAAGFSRPSTFAPVANMFGNLANQYYTNQLLNNYRQPYGVGQDVNSTYNLAGALGPTTL